VKQSSDRPNVILAEQEMKQIRVQLAYHWKSSLHSD
jgi:hypothetical protein